MMEEAKKTEARDVAAMRDHSRLWHANRYVYPVVSRRAKGLSIGINLSPSKACNFNCIYCQVNRLVAGPVEKVDLSILIRELNEMLDLVVTGELWAEPRFAAVPPDLRALHDIAFSGDGEPTVHRNFADIVQLTADAKHRHRMKDVKIVIISNGSRFHTQAFQRALPILLANNGQVWAKLDAGSQERFTRINGTAVPFKQVLENLESLALQMPLVIQSCFFKMDGAGPDEMEIELYIARLKRILERGGKLSTIQIYSIARPPRGRVSVLPDSELNAIAAQVRDALEDVSVEVFPGAEVLPQES